MESFWRHLCCIVSILILTHCSDTGFKGDGQKVVAGKTGDNSDSTTPDDSPETGEAGEVDNGEGGVTDRTGLDVEDDDIDLNITAPLIAYYEGDKSGDDAQFTFYIARTSPITDDKEMEVITSQRKQFLSRVHKEVCVCGVKNQMYFLWKHIRGRAGALHARNEGEWIVAQQPSDKNWLSKGLKTVATGAQTIFLGADTENPDFLTDPTGKGYLRTAAYAPNSPLSSKHKWSNRDDMKLAISCDIAKCPADLRSRTSIDLERDPSMNP